MYIWYDQGIFHTNCNAICLITKVKSILTFLKVKPEANLYVKNIFKYHYILFYLNF